MVTGLGFWPILLGVSLVGSGLWLKAQETQQERLAVEQEQVRLQLIQAAAQHPEAVQALQAKKPGADDTLLWLAAGITASALLLFVTGGGRKR